MLWNWNYQHDIVELQSEHSEMHAQQLFPVAVAISLRHHAMLIQHFARETLYRRCRAFPFYCFPPLLLSPSTAFPFYCFSPSTAAASAPAGSQFVRGVDVLGGGFGVEYEAGRPTCLSSHRRIIQFRCCWKSSQRV
ncbi:hypothetical protein BV898_12648 [Hypsibius exemplaris]|uniref:Uncharacterized protein n=1 Tax=Hypsibius exemplaris TaxID=2072580 RepID=A0A1W0WD49_HYPEX|nr:hypothetical protein BV898_12648 [Hypsibius exemplaris]